MSYELNDSPVLKKALKNLKSHSWSDAVENFTALVEESDDASPVLFLKRGLAYMGLKWWDEAIFDFKTALQLGLAEAEVFANLARTYRLKGWWDESIHFWGAALELDDGSADYFFSRGLAYFYKGWFNEAIEHFLAATHIDPTNQKITYALAVALNCRGQVDEAAQFLDKSIDLGGAVFGKMFEMFPEGVEVSDEMLAACGGKKKAAAKKAPKKAAIKKTAAKKAPKKAEKKVVKKVSKAKKTTTKKKKKGSMLDAAEKLLQEAGHSLHYKVLTREAIGRKLIDTTGSTPEQSMRSAISRDISRKGTSARFVRDTEKNGYYCLTAWFS